MDSDLLRLPAEEIADAAGVDISTARRWKRANRLPEPVARLLAITKLGRLDAIGWRGWRMVRGELVSPEGWTYQPGEVLALTLLRQRVSVLQAEHRKFYSMADQTEMESPDEALSRIEDKRA